jgi:hypothetical protein
MQPVELIESLATHRTAILAFVLALAAALAGRALRWPLLAGIAAGLGILGGWWLTFGLITASPRQLPERLPLLALMMLAVVVALAVPARERAWLAWPATIAGAAAAGWWMAGAPLVRADLLRAWPPLLGIGGATLALAWAARARCAGVAAAAALLAGLLLAPLPGPQLVLGGVVLAAALGAACVPDRGAAPSAVEALPLAAAVVGLAALPVLARGQAADWLVAAGPLAAVALGLPLGARLGGRWGAWAGAALVAAGCAVFAFLIR